MKVLGIETSTPRISVALVDGDTLLGERQVMVERNRTGLMPLVDELFTAVGLRPQALDAVAVGAGPGSFTGLRIGLSAARGIALARNIPAVGIPSLLALSLSASGPSTVLLDARRDEAYFQMFVGPGQPISKADIVPMAIAQAAIVPGTTLISSPFVDIALMARYGAAADPALHPPEPDYVRDADAKPQSAARIARLTP